MDGAPANYDARLSRVAEWYLSVENPDGGWPMRWGEPAAGGPDPASLLGTAYGLAIVRYARVSAADQQVQRALKFVLESAERGEWQFTRHPVYSILALSEWPEAFIDGGMGEGARVVPSDVHRTVEAALDYFEAAARAPGCWPNSMGGHACFAWTAKVLYALGRLRQRSRTYRNDPRVLRMIRDAGNYLAAGAGHGSSRGEGALPACGHDEIGSVANTALAVIALSHRHVEDVASNRDIWCGAYQAGAKWLLENHDVWDSNESGEHDPLANDGWQFAVWSLAPRACLSAGVSPANPNLARGLNFAFDRWTSTPMQGWYIRGDGLSGYSNWSVAQLGQVLKLAIARLDPLQVLDALQSGSFETASDITVVLDPDSRSVHLIRASGQREVVNLARQEKRYRLLEEFATRGVPAGGTLNLETLAPVVAGPSGNPWDRLRALAHQINETTRVALSDPSVQLFRTTSRPKPGIITTAQCRINGSTQTPNLSNVEDVTGISAATGDSY